MFFIILIFFLSLFSNLEWFIIVDILCILSFLNEYVRCWYRFFVFCTELFFLFFMVIFKIRFVSKFVFFCIGLLIYLFIK